MGEVPICKDHPTKQVIFWCEQCDKLVCSHCKKADHEGHKSRDIDKVANEKREALKLRLDKLRDSIRKAQVLFKEKCSSLEMLEESVKEMKEEVKIRAGKVEQWVQKHKAEMIQQTDEFADQNGRADLRSDIMEFEERLRILKTDEQSLKGVLNEDVKHHEVLQQWGSLSRVPTTFHEGIPLHETYVFFPDSLAVEWQQDLRRFIGVPRMAEASSRTSGMVTALEMKFMSEVKALHVMSEALVCIVFVDRTAEQSVDAGTLYLGVSNHERELVLQKRLGENIKRPRLSSTSTNKVVVACTVTGAKAIFDVASWSSEVEESNQLQQHLCCLKADSGKDTLARRLSTSRPKHYKIHEVSMDSTEPLFSVQTENPETVVADKRGEYFAVIQHCVEQVHAKVGKRSPSLSSVAPQASVAVFKRPSEANSKPQQPCITFRPAMENNFHPTDICFYRYVDQNVLLIAAASGIYMVEYEQGGVWSRILSRESPLLQTTISALTTDCDGGLWIGCKNGSILKWLPVDEVSKNQYQIPSCEAGLSQDQDYSDSDGFHEFSDDYTAGIQESAATENTSTAETALSVYNISEYSETKTASSRWSTSSRPLSSRSLQRSTGPVVRQVDQAEPDRTEAPADSGTDRSYAKPSRKIREDETSSRTRSSFVCAEFATSEVGQPYGHPCGRDAPTTDDASLNASSLPTVQDCENDARSSSQRSRVNINQLEDHTSASLPHSYSSDQNSLRDSTAWSEDASRRQSADFGFNKESRVIQTRCRPNTGTSAGTKHEVPNNELKEKFREMAQRKKDQSAKTDADSKGSAEEEHRSHSDKDVAMKSAKSDGLRRDQTERPEGRRAEGSHKTPPPIPPKPKLPS